MSNASVIPSSVLSIAIIILLVAVVVLTVRVVSMGKHVQKLTNAFIDERHKVSQIIRYLNGASGFRGNGANVNGINGANGNSANSRFGESGSGRSLPRQSYQSHQTNQSHQDYRPRSQGNAYHEEREKEREKRAKRGFGRRKKPVIPFGVDRTNEQRAVRAAAAMIDDGPALSADLSEPAQIMRQRRYEGQYAPRQSSMSSISDRRGQGQFDGTRQYPQSYPQQPQFQSQLQPAYGGVQNMQHGREMRQFGGANDAGRQGGMGRLDGAGRPDGMGRQGMPQGFVNANGERGERAPRHGRGFAQESRVQETRSSVAEDPEVARKIAREKAAVSAAWVAEETRRVEEKHAKQAVQAKHAARREQAQLRSQAEAIVQEHRRQSQSARDRNDRGDRAGGRNAGTARTAGAASVGAAADTIKFQ